MTESPNTAPVLTPIGDQTIDEEALLTFTATAIDSDIPANALTFSLDPGAPAGANITSGGDFTWTPDETQGLTDFTITVRVTDNGTPNLNDFEAITVTVNEVNTAPELDPIGAQTIDEGVELTFTATATDADLPAATLTFSVDLGAPEGASIDPATGLFSWTPTEDEGPGVFRHQKRCWLFDRLGISAHFLGAADHVAHFQNILWALWVGNDNGARVVPFGAE